MQNHESTLAAVLAGLFSGVVRTGCEVAVASAGVADTHWLRSPIRADSVDFVTVTVEIALDASPDVVEAFARLIPQLSKSSPAPTQAELAEMIESPASDVLLAREGDEILGTLTLITFRIPTGVRSWIEDVVVDGAARGKGVGDLLNRFALDVARGHGAKTVDLTSRPSREAANRLYHRIGFLPRETNIYRYDIES